MSNDQNDAEITPKKYVTDTMALVLWLENRKLPAKVKGIFEATTSLLASNSYSWDGFGRDRLPIGKK